VEFDMSGIVKKLTGSGKAFRVARAPELQFRQCVVERTTPMDFRIFFFPYSVVCNWNTQGAM